VACSPLMERPLPRSPLLELPLPRSPLPQSTMGCSPLSEPTVTCQGLLHSLRAGVAWRRCQRRQCRKGGGKQLLQSWHTAAHCATALHACQGCDSEVVRLKVLPSKTVPPKAMR